eukprot:TRINITY_DN50_c0_g1_i6.p1 TRINITY_DN50_c0_g1~~TRINITY_DN50_c0_g1_i6.p1  ORF type:complete len:489 (+),score=67.04 TRINITY_DN50_c0_g1_i6:542-2008(+)
MGDPSYSPLWSGGLLEDPLWSPPFDHTLPNTGVLFAPPSPYNSPHFNSSGGVTTRIDRFGREVRCFYGCQPVFNSDEQLQQHVMKQHEISRCQYGCDPVFDRFDALRQHVAEQHAAEREGARYSSLLFQPRLLRPDVSCFYGCGPTFRDEEQLREHVRQQHEINKCQFGCGPRFERFEQLQEHVYTSHAPGNPVSLSPIFSDNRDGTMTDRQGNTYVCHYDSCGRAFPVLTQLSQHRAQTHHEQTLVSSPTLGATTMDSTSDGLLDTLPLPSLESMVGAQNMSHNSSGTSANKVKNEQGGEGEHSNHGHSWDGKCHSVLSESSAAAHRCEKCGSTFKENTNLTRHQQQAHRGKKEHVCDYCHTPFGRKSNLKTHVDTVHFQKRRFGCEKCGQRFTQKGNLATHFRTKHLGRRDFICESCGQSFARNETRRVHVRIVHEKRKDFVCSHCPGKGFATKSNLVRHVKAHHGEEVASAIVKPKPEPIVLVQK